VGAPRSGGQGAKNEIEGPFVRRRNNVDGAPYVPPANGQTMVKFTLIGTLMLAADDVTSTKSEGAGPYPFCGAVAYVPAIYISGSAALDPL